jgi:HPt (histidine-containing phosphotransfer) domain-containing protein
MAMKHLSGDIMQFVRIAEVFVERAEGSISELKELIRNKDYSKAAFIIHSVKGNSGNVGAQDLYYNARRLEKRAKDGDGKYVDTASELFFMEWRRAKEGLTIFLDEFAKVGARFKSVPTEEVLDENALMEKLLEAVRNGNQSPALKTIDEIEAIRGKMPEISAIREAVKDIDFDRAEKIIEELKR